MLHHSRQLLLGPGIGDTFWPLPWVRGVPHLRLSLPPFTEHFPGIARLIDTLLPGVSYGFDGDGGYDHFKRVFRGYRFDEPLSQFFCRQLKLPHQPTFPPEVVDRIPPQRMRRPFILVHPHAGEAARRWGGWNELGLEDFHCYGVGEVGDGRPVRGLEYLWGDFWTLARRLRGAVGLVCVDSCVLNLANVLNIPTLGIYTGKVAPYKQSAMRPAQNGVSLDFPKPEEVRHHLETMFSRAARRAPP